MKKHTRSLALLLAVIFALGCVSLAQALEVTNGSIVTTITAATVYKQDTASATMKAIGTLAAGTPVTVYGTNGSLICFWAQDKSGTAYLAWIEAKDVTAGASGTTTGATIGTITGATTGTPGIIVNCNSGVRMRSGAGTGNTTTVTVVSKGATVSVLSSEKGSDGKTWYKVTYGKTTGYIRSDYVSTTGTVSTGTGTPADTNTDGSGTSMVALDNVIYMRKTASSSTSGAPRLTGVRGKTFTILGESGSFYYASYGSNKGYVRKQDFSTGSSGSGATTGTTMTYAAVTKGDADKWGYIKQIPGTQIGTDAGVFNSYIYCNGLNAKKTDYYYNTISGSTNYIFSIAPQGVETSVISGHNMQKSHTGFHQLHHVQNALLGVSTCEESSCGANCSGAGATTFYINYAGKTAWQVVGFFEINQDTVASEATRKSIQSSTLLNFTLTGAQKQAWINQVMSYANQNYKGKAISNATSDDKLMVLYTCGDHGNAGARAKANGAGSSKGGYQNLYFLLKAVG